MAPLQAANDVKAQKPDLMELWSRRLTLLAAVLAVLACLMAPVMAISWSKRPFPGFIVESTLVVNDTGGEGWSGWQAGIRYNQRVVRVGGRAVTTSAEYNAALLSLSGAEQTSVFTVLPDGTQRLFPAVQLTSFPRKDLMRLFWLPLAVGLAYLAIGIWVYRVGGNGRPGRALAFFCFCGSVACTLLFDATTTHVGTTLWILAIAQLGGALLSLAMRFPVEWGAIERRAWLLALPYGISIVLAGWGLLALANRADPWAYIASWGASYRYAAVGILTFIGTTLFRALASQSTTIRRQARIVLMGSALAFTPIVIWFLSPVFGVSLSFNTALFLPALVIFPIAVALAIFRYRLLEVDALVNRTLFYGLVTAILAGIGSGVISLLQILFVFFTGEKSDVAILITSLILVAAFEPIRKRLHSLIDRQFEETPDTTRDLVAYAHDVRCFLEMNDPGRIVVRLLDEAARGLQARSGRVSLKVGGQLQTVHTVGRWQGEASMAVPLIHDGQQLGLLLLGPRSSGQPYTEHETELVAQTAGCIAQAIHRAWSAAPALDRRGNGNGIDRDAGAALHATARAAAGCQCSRSDGTGVAAKGS